MSEQAVLEREELLAGKDDYANLSGLRKALYKLNIAPFTAESVEKYQKKVTKRLNDRLDNIVLGGLLATFACLIGMFAGWLFSYGTIYWCLAFGCCLITTIASVLIFSIPELDRDYFWEKTLVKEYTKPIPERVRDRIGELERELPKAKIYIVGIKSVPDPFALIVYFDKKIGFNETIYFDVWDERDFQKKLN